MILLYVVQLQVGIIKDNHLFQNLLVDIKDFILVVLLWVVFLWLCLGLLDLCMSYLVLRNLNKKVVWLIGRSSVIVVVSCVLAIYSTVLIVELILLYILLVKDIVLQLGKC